MKKVIVTLLTLCMVSVVIPPVPTDDNDDYGISPYAYSFQEEVN